MENASERHWPPTAVNPLITAHHFQAQLRSKIPEVDEEKPADSVKQDASVVSGECRSGIAGVLLEGLVGLRGSAADSVKQDASVVSGELQLKRLDAHLQHLCWAAKKPAGSVPCTLHRNYCNRLCLG